jgi:hypothetical protein
MNNLDIVELVKVGFHGAAIAMAILTFFLLRKAVANWGPDVPPGHIPVLNTLLREIRVFMCVSLLFFVLGVAAQIFVRPTKQTTAKVFVSPSRWPKSIDSFALLTRVKHEQKAIALDDGEASVAIDDRDEIRFMMDDLVMKLQELDANYKTLLSKQGVGF